LPSLGQHKSHYTHIRGQLKYFTRTLVFDDQLVKFRLPFGGLDMPNAAIDQIELGIGVNSAARISMLEALYPGHPAACLMILQPCHQTPYIHAHSWANLLAGGRTALFHGAVTD